MKQKFFKKARNRKHLKKKNHTLNKLSTRRKTNNVSVNLKTKTMGSMQSIIARDKVVGFRLTNCGNWKH